MIFQYFLLCLTCASGVATNSTFSTLSLNNTDDNSTFASTGAPEFLFSAIYTAASPQISTTTTGAIGSTKSASTSTSAENDATTLPITSDEDSSSDSTITTTSTIAVTDPTTTSKSIVTTNPNNEPTTSSSLESTIVTSTPEAETDTTVITNDPTTISTTVKSDPTNEPTTSSTTYADDSSSTTTSSLSTGHVTTPQVTTSSVPASAESTKVTSRTTNLIISETTDPDLVLAEEYMNVLSELVETEEFLIELQSQGSNLAQVSSIELVGNLTIVSGNHGSSGRAEVEAACKLAGITLEQFGTTEQDAFVKLIAQDLSVEENQVVIFSISELTPTRKLLVFRSLSEAGILVDFGIIVPEESSTTTSTTIVTEEPTENLQLPHAIPGEIIAIIAIFALLVLTAVVIVAVVIHRKYAEKANVDEGESTYDIEAPRKETSLHNSYLSAEACSTSPKGLQLKPLTSITYSPLHKDPALAKLVSSHPTTTSDEEEMVVRSFSSIHSP